MKAATTLTTLILGGLLAVLVIFMFLRNIWFTFTIALSIPVSIIATFFFMAVLYRRKLQYHKRLMVLAAVNLVEAAIIRIPIGIIGAGVPFTSRGLSYLFIVALVAWDIRTSGRVHRVTLWGSLLIMISFPARMLISQTQTWTEIAGWLVQWVE